jgi:hypothetical protein
MVDAYKSADDQKCGAVAGSNSRVQGECAFLSPFLNGSLPTNALLFRSPRCPAPDGVTATDPASASPGRLIASLAMSCVCMFANGVPTKPRGTLAERVREGRRPSSHCSTEIPKKPSGRAHISHTKCGPKANLHGVLEEIPLIEKISGHHLSPLLEASFTN